MTRQPDKDEVKAMLLARIEALCAVLAPEGQRSGGYWMCRSAAHATKTGGMWIKLSSGAWRDEAAAEKGDVFRLIQYRNGMPFEDFAAAMKWAREWLGIESGPGGVDHDAWKTRAAEAQAVQASREREQVDQLERDRRTAKAIYLEAKKRKILRSPIDAYLRSRGIELERLGRKPGALGWLPEAKHYESGQSFPCMVAGFTAPSGEIVSVHRTWIAHDGSRKAPVTPQKKIWPAFGGSAIRLWRGSSGLSIDDAAKHGLREPLALTEGIENGLSVVMAAPELRVWCVGALVNIAKQTLPECVDEVIVVADNDWGNPQAQDALKRAVAALQQQGRAVRVARSFVGKDVNDALRGMG